MANRLEQKEVEMQRNKRDSYIVFLGYIKEPMFRSYIIYIESQAIFKPYIFSSSKESALSFER